MIRYLIKLFINPWVILGAVVIAVLLMLLVAFGISFMRPDSNPSGIPTAILAVTKAPTPTVLSIIDKQETATSTPETPPSPQPGIIRIGGYTQISGTGGEGLNLRAEPNLDATILYLGLESEVFEVRDGPQEADGFTWWYLVGFSDSTRNGWAVSNYLDVIQNP